MTYLDVGWTCAEAAPSFFAAVKWLSEPKSVWCQALSRSMVRVYGWVMHATPPHDHPTSRCPGMSLYVISLTRPSPTSVLHVTNTWGRRPGNEVTSDVITVGRYDTLVVYDGNIQGCKSFENVLAFEDVGFFYIHINLDRIMEYICMPFHADQYVWAYFHLEKIPTTQSVIAALQEVA